MKKAKFHIYLNDHEKTLILHSLVELKNSLLRQGRDTYCIDEIIIKVMSAPIKRLKVV